MTKKVNYFLRFIHVVSLCTIYTIRITTINKLNYLVIETKNLYVEDMKHPLKKTSTSLPGRDAATGHVSTSWHAGAASSRSIRQRPVARRSS